MRRYETIVIIDPDLGEEGRTQIFEQVEELIKQYNGRLVKFDEWGNRKLAYKIRKKPRGHYVRLDYCGTTDLVNEMERRFKINDAYLKFMTVVLEKEIDLGAIEAEIAEEEKMAAEAREKARLAAEQAQAKAEENKKDEAVPEDEPLTETKAEAPPVDAPAPEAVAQLEPEAVEISTDDPASDEKE